jgi:hypothetical protein
MHNPLQRIGHKWPLAELGVILDFNWKSSDHMEIPFSFFVGEAIGSFAFDSARGFL